MSSLVAIARWTLLAAAAVTIAACDSDAPRARTTVESKPKATPTPPPTDSVQLERLLIARERALEDRDRAAFLATSTGAQARRDERAFAAADALPVESVELTADATEIDGDRATMRVDMSYRFGGIDSVYYKRSRMTARKTPEGWRISSDRPAAGTLAPWEHTRYTARTSKHFLALAPRKLKVGKLMRELERGRRHMVRGLPDAEPPGKVLVIVARNGRDINALTKDRKTRRSLLAVAEAQYATTGPAKRVSRIWGERVFVMWKSYKASSLAQRRQIVAHELVHVALAKRTSARTPPWLYEGIALYASGDNRSGDAGALISGRGVLRDSSEQADARRAMSLARLSRPTALERLNAVGISFAYSYASATAYTIVREHGRTALLRLLTAYNSSKNKGSGRRLADRVVRRTLGKSLATLEREVDAYASANSRF